MFVFDDNFMKMDFKHILKQFDDCSPEKNVIFRHYKLLDV